MDSFVPDVTPFVRILSPHQLQLLNKLPVLNQGQTFVAVIKAKNRGAATSQNAKNHGIAAAKIVKIAAMSRQKL